MKFYGACKLAVIQWFTIRQPHSTNIDILSAGKLNCQIFTKLDLKQACQHKLLDELLRLNSRHTKDYLKQLDLTLILNH